METKEMNVEVYLRGSNAFNIQNQQKYLEMIEKESERNESDCRVVVNNKMY